MFVYRLIGRVTFVGFRRLFCLRVMLRTFDFVLIVDVDNEVNNIVNRCRSVERIAMFSTVFSIPLRQHPLSFAPPLSLFLYTLSFRSTSSSRYCS